AQLVGSVDLRPGEGIDFTALGWVLLGALGLYLIASVFMWLQGVLATTAVQRMVAGLRGDVEEQIHHLPLAYLDGQERGEILSRTTNDIDNLAQSLQQTLSQAITSLL